MSSGVFVLSLVSGVITARQLRLSAVVWQHDGRGRRGGDVNACFLES